MKSFWLIWVGLKSNDKCPYRRHIRSNRERKQEDHVKMEAEIGIVLPPTRVYLEPPEVAPGKKGPL